MTKNLSQESQPSPSDALLVPADAPQKLEHIGPPWATSVQADDSVVWWIYECETAVEMEDFDHPGAPPLSTIVRLERADGVERTMNQPGPGVPASLDITVEQGQDMVVIDVMGHDDKPTPQLRMTRRQAEQLGRALAEAVTVHYERTLDVFPGRAGRSPIGDDE